MDSFERLLTFNKQFVKDKAYVTYETNKFPDKKMVILTCMDTRLTELLPKALGLKNGDAKIIKNAGAVITEPFGSVMRSLLVAIYELRADEVYVIGHKECGMISLNADSMIKKMKSCNISNDVLNTLLNSGIDLENWLKGFNSVYDSVEQTAHKIYNHPLFPKKIPVHGLVIDPKTGELEIVKRDGIA